MSDTDTALTHLARPVDDAACPALIALDLRSVETYLLIQRLWAFAGLHPGTRWCPLLSPPTALDLDRAAAEKLASELRLGLVWPERHPQPVRRAMRFALHEADRDDLPRLVFGLSRLAFGGCANLDDDEKILFCAKVDTDLNPEQALAAADDPGLDGALEQLARSLAEVGISQAPALRLDGQNHTGFAAIMQALEAAEALSNGSRPRRPL